MNEDIRVIEFLDVKGGGEVDEALRAMMELEVRRQRGRRMRVTWTGSRERVSQREQQSARGELASTTAAGGPAAGARRRKMQMQNADADAADDAAGGFNAVPWTQASCLSAAADGEGSIKNQQRIECTRRDVPGQGGQGTAQSRKNPRRPVTRDTAPGSS